MRAGHMQRCSWQLYVGCIGRRVRLIFVGHVLLHFVAVSQGCDALRCPVNWSALDNILIAGASRVATCNGVILSTGPTNSTPCPSIANPNAPRDVSQELKKLPGPQDTTPCRSGYSRDAPVLASSGAQARSPLSNPIVATSAYRPPPAPAYITCIAMTLSPPNFRAAYASSPGRIQ